MNKSKKVLAVVVTVVMALLLTAMVLLLCLLPSKNDGPTNTGSDDTTQTPGDSSDTNDGNSGSDSSDTNGGSTNTGSDDTQQTPGDSSGGDDTPQTPGDSSDSDNSGSTDNPSDTEDPTDEYQYETPSAVILSADKTELAPGDTFTLTVEIATNRTDMYWQAVALVIGPMSDTTTVSTDIASNFELLSANSYTLPEFVTSTAWHNFSSDKFTSTIGTGGFKISLATGSTYTPTTEKFVITAQIKVKETATPVDDFLFGITDVNRNRISFVSMDDKQTLVYDQADGSTINNNTPDTSGNCGITTQKITMSIKAKSN